MVTNLGIDPATGVAEAYDFKGNLLHSVRRFAADYMATPDWAGAPALAAESFTSASRFDALNRVTEATAPNGSVLRTAFNDAGQPEQVEVNLRGAVRAGGRVWTSVVARADYNARGERTHVEYGCGARTTYSYDPQTFRLRALRTTRTPGQNGASALIFQDPATVQDLSYVHDPVGNITRITDAALRTVFNGQAVQPARDYGYDATYRLTEASGREHIGQSGFVSDLARRKCRDLPFVGSAQLSDPQALRNYVERYAHDAAGNLVRMSHMAQGGTWTRSYAYGEASGLRSGETGDRLGATSLDARGPGPTPRLEPLRRHGQGAAPDADGLGLPRPVTSLVAPGGD